MRISGTVCVVLAAILLACPLLSFAGPNGNLAGKVTDVKTGEALPYVNILVVGSGRGTVTNDKGEFSITGITPGQYVIRASLLGYKTVESGKVTIQADQTSVYNFKLASTDIELEGVTVEGQPPIVDVKKTAGDQTYNKDKIEQLPNVKGVEDVLSLQSGVVKFGQQLFLRGGRANETQILIDGVPVNDVGGSGGASGTSNANEQLQQLYSGNSSSGAGGALSVSAQAIQSVSVSSSGLDAEYGNAQSGVVNITTRSGSDSYTGSMQSRTDGITSQTFNERYYSGTIGGPEPITTHLLPSLGVNIPGKITFFTNASFNQSDGPYDFSKRRFYNPLRRKVRFSGFWGDLFNDLGFTYDEKQNNEFTFNHKFSYQPGENDQIAFSYRANAKSAHPLSGYYSWRDLSDSTITNVSLITQNVLQWTHIFGTNTLLRAYLSRLENDRTSAVGALSPGQYSYVTRAIDRDPNRDGFNDLGTSQSWGHSNTTEWNFKVAFESKVHPLHQLKAGFEHFYTHRYITSISFPTDRGREIDPNGRGEYPRYGFGRWVSNNMPSRGAFWVQDNIEFSQLNIKVGLRYDYFYLGNQVNDVGALSSYPGGQPVGTESYVARWLALTRNRNNPAASPKAEWLENNTFFSQFIRGYVSPRLAIGYPVSERTVFFFNYSHFLQYPELDQLYHDPWTLTVVADNYVGNPSLKPQKTIAYEAGFNQAIFDDLAIGITGFYKDIFDYATLQRLTNVDLYVNLDYASARGVEVSLNKNLSNHYLGSIGYTFQLAKGRASNPFAPQSSPQLFQLPRETRLDYDQQHTIVMFVGYRINPREDFTLFGIPFDNFGASVTWNYGSGFPYTPYNPGSTLEDLYLKNTGDGPYTSQININIYKGFTVYDRLNLVLTMDITNLLNRRNVDLNAGGFNTLIGRPLQYGDYRPDTKKIYTWGGAAGEQSFDSRVPPFIFGPPRQISFGLRINWD
jgi:hypothetical protein